MTSQPDPSLRGLGRLKTDLGERSTYDAVSQCSRCGYCEQACPTYVATGAEPKSARGRNQLVRLILEGKLKDLGAAREALETCLLCGACGTACYAHVPTADLVLEGRRMLGEKPHWLARLLSALLVSRPGALEGLLKAAYFFKRLGLSRLARPFLGLIGLKGLALADEHVAEAPRELLREQLRRIPKPSSPSWSYFSPCGSNYLYPRVGLATMKAAGAALGPGAWLENGCCGLLCYNYGEVADARTLAKRAIERSEALAPGVPVVGDCSSCVAFLKGYPQLFLEDAAWKERAEKFSASVRDVVEVLASSRSLPEAADAGVVTYHDSCRACHGQGLAREPREVMRKACGESFRELPQSDVCCGGAGAFAFSQPELSDEILRRKIGAIAAVQARLVATSSTSCLIQLAHGLSKYYPECRVVHLSELVAAAFQSSGEAARPSQ